MTQQILIKRSAVAAKAPTTAQIALGELAVNTYDGKLYLKKSVSGVDSIIEVGSTTISGDASGSGNGSITLTLANSGVTAGTYPKVTVDAKGRVTAGASLSASDVPSLDWSKITSGKPTTLAGYGIVGDQALTGGSLSIDTSGDSTKQFYLIGANGKLRFYLQDGTGRAHMSWNTTGGTSPTFEVGAEDAVSIDLGSTASGAGGSFLVKSADGSAAAAGGAISWTSLLYVDLNTISYKGFSIPVISPSAPKDGDIQVSGSTVKVYASGAWKQVYPAVYS